MIKFIVLLAFLGPNFSFADSTFDLRVVSYNIKGLPPVAGGYNKHRFSEIGRLLRAGRQSRDGAHIVALQEAFILDTALLQKTAQFPFEAKGPAANFAEDENGRHTSKIYNSGLVLLSEFPIHKSDGVIFGSNNCKSWDCYANKGVQSALVDVPNLPFLLPVLNTHMQAGRDNEAIRKIQNSILSRYLKRHFSGGAFVFPGDFNFRQTQQSYHDFFAKVPMALDSGVICASSAGCKISSDTSLDEAALDNVDHQLYSHGILPSRDGQTQYEVQIEPLYIHRGFRETFQGRALSDHLSYEVTFRIHWRKVPPSFTS